MSATTFSGGAIWWTLTRWSWHGVLCRLKAVWSMPERFKVVCIPCKALYKCSALAFFTFYHTYVHMLLHYLVKCKISKTVKFSCIWHNNISLAVIFAKLTNSNTRVYNLQSNEILNKSSFNRNAHLETSVPLICYVIADVWLCLLYTSPSPRD